MKDYNGLLRKAREQAGINRETLAKRLGVNVRCVVDHELGGSEPQLSYCIRTADTLHISIDELIGREHKPLWVVAKPQEWRETFGITQKELTDKALVSRGALRGLENGTHDTRIGIVELLADALELGVDEYLGHEVQ